MGIISIDKISQLYWLGRYTERVFTTIRSFTDYYDRMIDQEEYAYREFCRELSIPDVYGSKEAFLEKYPYDETNPDSLYSNLCRAFDNAVTLREEISSEVLAYIQMALDKLKESRKREELLGLQEIEDYLFAFWGSVDDYVENEDCRNIMKCGKYAERLDLYLRLSCEPKKLEKEFRKFVNRLQKLRIGYDQERILYLEGIIAGEEPDEARRREAIAVLNGIVGGM